MKSIVIDVEKWASADARLSKRPPELTFYQAEEKKTEATVLILPGGGYFKLSDFEGEGYAEYLAELGMNSFVLKYRYSPDIFPAPLKDARWAMRYIRQNATLYGIDKNRIAIMGSSAGGHLAELTSTYRGDIGDGEWDLEDYLPNAQILCYPVTDISSHRGSYENLLGEGLDELLSSVTPTIIADENTPPAFIWHTSTDEAVNIESTYAYAKRLHQLGIPCEMHVFPLGGHGLGLADEEYRNIPYVARWAGMLKDWLIFSGYLPE